MHEPRKNPSTSVQEKPMTTDTRPFEEMNAIAKQIKEQALVATDDYFKFLKKTVSSHPARGSEVGDVLKSNAQRNIEFRNTCTNSAKRRIFRTPCECKPSTSQFAVFGEQTKTLSEACGKSAVRVFNSSFKNVA